jgi:uncharacterized protein (TIGR03435 family)
LLLLLAVAPRAWSQSTLPAGADPQPVNGIEFVVDALDKYPIVAIGDLPGCEELHEFIRTLVRTPAFQAKASDIVVEFGNPLFQPLIDRYVLDGELTPRDTLRHVWDDTTESPFLTWDSPVYEEFFDAVRAVNMSLEKDKRIHVILADAPIVWRTIQNREQLLGYTGLKREQALAAKIGEVLSKHRRALVISAAPYVYRTSSIWKASAGQALSLLPQGRFGSGDAYKLIEARQSQFSAPAAAMVHDTWLGAVPLDSGANSPRLDRLVDAVLYLGKSDGLTVRWPSAHVFQNDEFWAELNRRWRLTQGTQFDLAKAGFDLRGPLVDVSMPISDDSRPQLRTLREEHHDAAHQEHGQGHAGDSAPPPPGLTPTNAADFTFGKLAQYPIVGLGDLHLCLEFHQFVQQLVRDPRLPGKINDIIVEFGNPKYQDVIDRYVVKGEDVPLDERKHAWQEAAIGWYVGNSPVYEQFFDGVRQVNLGLPHDKRIRVVLGDAFVDLAQFQANPEQYLQRFAARETAQDPREIALAASVNQVLAQGHRAIVIAGNGHLKLNGRSGNARQMIERENPGKFFLIDTSGPGHRSWPAKTVVTRQDDPEPVHATLWLGPIESLMGVRPSPLIYRDRRYLSAVSLIEQLTRRWSTLDLADPIFEYRGRYFDRIRPIDNRPIDNAWQVDTPADLYRSDAQGLTEFVLGPGAPGGGHFSMSSAGITADSISLQELIAFSFDVPAARVVGPPWLDDKYKVSASAPDGGDFRVALQGALARRLHLRFERANRVLPVAVIRVADAATFQSHLSQGKGEARLDATNSSVSAANAPMTNLEQLLSSALHRPVVNETGSTGPFTFELQWKAGNLKSLADALRDHLGIGLADERREIPVVVADRESSH